MSDFDFDKPYRPTRWERVAPAVGIAINTFFVLRDTAHFLLSLGVLWGWYFLGLFSCALLLARLFDGSKAIRAILRGQIFVSDGERLANVYFVVLVAISVLVNATFALLYLTGRYYPPFGDVPIH